MLQGSFQEQEQLRYSKDSHFFSSQFSFSSFFSPLSCVSLPFCPYPPLYLPFLLLQDVLSLYSWITFYLIRFFLPHFHHEWRLLGLLALFRPLCSIKCNCARQVTLIYTKITIESSRSFKKLL